MKQKFFGVIFFSVLQKPGGSAWTEPCTSSPVDWWPGGGSGRSVPGLWSAGATEVTFRPSEMYREICERNLREEIKRMNFHSDLFVYRFGICK